eukprot:GHVS01000096.1.p1 GENE.GHVS01000096.1~~GHVS01000096.1.p1  ORF type:complete len:226 (-),score=10.81 GHVS01000096.1:182-859(-)
MVSFTCGVCQDVVKKNQIDKHCSRAQCASAWHFTCIDCNKTFEGYDYQSHNSCISEEDKYYGKFAKRKTVKAGSAPTDEKETQEGVQESSINKDKFVGAEPTEPCKVPQAIRVPDGCTELLRRKRKQAPDDEPSTASTLAEFDQAVSPIPWAKLIEKALSTQTGDSISWKSLAKEVVKIVMKDSSLSCERVSKKRLVQKCLSEASVPSRLLAPETGLRLVAARSV